MTTRADHLQEELVVAFLTGRASADERAQVEQHIDGCTTCRELVSALAATSSASVSSPAPPRESDHGPISDDALAGGTPSLLPGDRIDDRFVLIEHAGKGGMGHVYRARDLASGGVVALKTMRLADPELSRRFEREARVLEELNDPAVVRYVARGTTADKQAYLVMDWVEGESLALRLRRGPLEVPATLHLVRRIAGGLAAAHARGIVHRDVKPANVLLPGGDVRGAVLIDFGIAHTHARPGTAATRRGAFLGTPGYMAPEQTRGGGALDARADVFSLGCLAYECLTGAVPFAGADFLESLAKLLLETPRPASAKAPEVPPALDALLLRMLAKEPDQRPADAAALLTELEAIEATPRRPPRTRRAGMALVALGLASLAAGTVGLSRARGVALIGWGGEPDPGPATTVTLVSTGDASTTLGDEIPLVLVLGIENRTVNTQLDGTADEIFVDAVAASAKVDGFAGPGLRDRLASADAGADHIDESSARELAAHEQRRVLTVRGFVASRAGGYDLDLTVQDSAGGPAIVTAHDRGLDAPALVRALSDHACELRVRLGDDEPGCSAHMSSNLEADDELMLGNAQNVAGQNWDALVHFEHALDEDPGFARAHAARSNSLYQLGRTSEALAEVDLALRDPSALDESARRVLRATAAYMRGQYDVVVSLLREEVARKPGNASLQARLANAYAALLDWDDALAIGRRNAAEHPLNPRVRANLLWYEYGAGDLEAVQRDGLALLADMRAVPSAAYFFLAMAQTVRGDDEGANETVALYRALDALAGAAMAADVAAYRGSGASAITDLAAAIDTSVHSKGEREEIAAARSLLAELQLAAGDRAGALATLRLSARPDATPEEDRTIFKMGQTYIALGRPKEATALMAELRSRGREERVDRMASLCLEAELAAARGDMTARLAHARAAMQALEGSVSRLELARALLAAGDVDGGRKLLELSLARPWETAAGPFDDTFSDLRELARARALLAATPAPRDASVP